MNSKYLSNFAVDEVLSLGIKLKCAYTVIGMGNGSVDTTIIGINDVDVTVNINIRGVDMTPEIKWIVINNINTISIYVNDAAREVPFKELEKLITHQLEIVSAVYGDKYHEAFKTYHKVICEVNDDGETIIRGDIPLTSCVCFYEMPEMM